MEKVKFKCTNDDFKEIETFLMGQYYLEPFPCPLIELYNVDTETTHTYELVNLKDLNNHIKRDEYVFREI